MRISQQPQGPKGVGSVKITQWENHPPQSKALCLIKWWRKLFSSRMHPSELVLLCFKPSKQATSCVGKLRILRPSGVCTEMSITIVTPKAPICCDLEAVVRVGKCPSLSCFSRLYSDTPKIFFSVLSSQNQAGDEILTSIGPWIVTIFYLQRRQSRRLGFWNQFYGTEEVTQVFLSLKLPFSHVVPREKVWAQTFLLVSYWRRQAKTSSCWCHIHSPWV